MWIMYIYYHYTPLFVFMQKKPRIRGLYERKHRMERKRAMPAPRRIHAGLARRTTSFCLEAEPRANLAVWFLVVLFITDGRDGFKATTQLFGCVAQNRCLRRVADREEDLEGLLVLAELIRLAASAFGDERLHPNELGLFAPGGILREGLGEGVRDTIAETIRGELDHDAAKPETAPLYVAEPERLGGEG